MAESQQEGSTPSRDLDETRDDLAQASLALNTAYDRLQDLRTSLRNFTAQRDRLTSERARQVTRMRSAGTMGPDHSAIVFSDSEEESEIDMNLLRESLPARLLELTSRWRSQHARLSAARRSAASDRNDNSLSLATSSSDEPRPIYPPLRRPRALPSVGSLRDGGITPPGPTSPARRSILEAHLRQLRHASNPGDATTTLGRRVAQRAAAASQGSSIELQGTRSVAQSDTIVHSTLPSGIEPRPYTPGPESRAASHLRYSLLPNPTPSVRTSSGSRMSTTAGGPHPRFSERTEHRPRTARSNSLTALTRGTPSTANVAQRTSTQDASTQTLLSTRLGQLRNTATSMSEDDSATRHNGMSELGEPAGGSYRVRRRVNGQGEEHVFSINWGELMSDADREDGLFDPAAWLRPPQPPRTSRTRSGRTPSIQDPETDDTVVQDYAPFSIREGREGSVQRRRGWAHLNADGDEISTEDEATIERSRVGPRMQRTRNWSRSNPWWGGLTYRHSRDASIGHPDTRSDEDGGAMSQPEADSRHIINSMFRQADASAAYASPLPVPKAAPAQECTKEVQVILNGRIVGR